MVAEWFSQQTFGALLSVGETLLFLYLMGYTVFLFASVVVGSNQLLKDTKRKQLKNEIHHDYYVPVSIIVPAYNEEVTILSTIQSLLHLDYKLYEIIIVNDGSQDCTADLVVENFGLHPVYRPIHRQVPCQDARTVYEGKSENKISITLINKKNGGKADALNMGINVAKYPYFICMDADSILQKDSLTKIVVPVLENQNVIAVGSMIRILNDSTFENGQLVQLRLPKKWLPAFQVLEYERSFLTSRILLDYFNANLIISGAFGLFKKDAVIQVGGYQVGCIGEDMELIMKLHAYYLAHAIPYRIKYTHDAVCWTQAPEKLQDFIKQRRRWHIGLMQSMFRHTTVAGKFSYFYYVFYELFSPTIEICGIIMTLLSCWFGRLQPTSVLCVAFAYAVFGTLLTILPYLARNCMGDTRLPYRDVIRTVLVCIPENIGLHFVLVGTRLLAMFQYRGKKVSWGKITRYRVRYQSNQGE